MIGQIEAISAAQCRAGRAMLEWSQDQLAENARVARPTIADFERNTRFPMRNNLFSIISAFEAAGLEFIADNEDGGAGVRFRRVELEYSKTLKSRGDDLLLSTKYRGTRIDVLLPRELLDDMDHSNLRTIEARLKSAQEHLHQILVATEARLRAMAAPYPTQIALTFADFPAGIF